MNNEEFKKLTEEYIRAHKEYNDYADRFFTHMENGIVTQEADLILNQEGIQKLNELKEKLDKSYAEWFEEAKR